MAHIPFDGNAVDIVSGAVADNRGATVADNTGATLDVDRFGQPGSAYFFDGDDWMTLDLPQLPLGDAPRMLSTWVRSADGQQDYWVEHLVSWGQTIANQAFGLMLYGNEEWYAYHHAYDIATGVTVDRAWHHLAVTFTEGVVAVYVDGRRRATASRALDTGAGPLMLGTRPDFHPGTSFDGVLDDIRIHDRTLGDHEIAALYAWEHSRTVVESGYVVQVHYGDALTDLDFGNNDSQAGFTVTPPPESVHETGTSADFTVVLDEQPFDDVTIELRSNDTSELTISTNRLTFTPQNWDAEQTVTVTGVNDDYDDGDRMVPIILEPAESRDLNYAGLDPPDPTFVCEDDDTNGFSVVPTGIIVTESGVSVPVTVTLNARPMNDPVVLEVTSSDIDQVRATPTRLIFEDSDDWNTPRTVDVSGVDEPVVDGDRLVTVTVSVDDPASNDGWDSLPDQIVEVLAINDDVPDFVVTITGDDTTVSETGTMDSFTIALTRQPLSSVVITVTSGDAGEALVSPPTLTFTDSNWYRPQSVDVLGVDDPFADGPQTTLVTVSIDDANSRSFLA